MEQKKSLFNLKFLIPFAVFLVLSGFLYKGLFLDPRKLPSVLINKPMPEWQLPLLFDKEKNFDPKAMSGKVWLLNVWATWCVPCKQEHPFMVDLKRKGLKNPIVGLLYRDQTSAAEQWLRQAGNPYDIAVFEPKASATIDLGVTGVPETFVVDKKGVIRAKVSYPLTPELWNEQIQPLLAQLEAE